MYTWTFIYHLYGDIWTYMICTRHTFAPVHLPFLLSIHGHIYLIYGDICMVIYIIYTVIMYVHIYHIYGDIWTYMIYTPSLLFPLFLITQIPVMIFCQIFAFFRNLPKKFHKLLHFRL